MCTQKMLFVLPGALLGLGLWALADRRRALVARMRAVLIVCVGVAVPALFTWIGFAVHGGGRQFIYNNFLLNAKWQLGSCQGRGGYAQDQLANSGPRSPGCFRRHVPLSIAPGSVNMGTSCCSVPWAGSSLELPWCPWRTNSIASCHWRSRACLPRRACPSSLELVQERARAWFLVCATLPALGLARSRSEKVLHPPRRPTDGAAALRFRAHRAADHGAGWLAGNPAVSSASALLLLHAPRAAGHALGKRQGLLPAAPWKAGRSGRRSSPWTTS